jgi:toxin-antitoxin system PIN domain toxin
VLAVDANVLVYSHRREVPEHAQALEIVRGLAEGTQPWAIPWPCLYEFWSVVTHPRIWKDAATSPDKAWAQVEAWLASPQLRLLAETREFAPILEKFLKRPRVRGPIVHDARVAALCVAHGVEALVTRDRDFSLFGELVTRDPFAS